MSPFDWLEMRSLRDRFLSWVYPHRGWSADLHEDVPAATEPKAGAAPPETTAGREARANAG